MDGEIGWEVAPAILAEDRESAAAALFAARHRVKFTTDIGTELTRPEYDTGEYYMPNYVADVHMTEQGPVILTDTKGEIGMQMAEAFVRVIAEELEERNIVAHVRAPPPGMDLAHAPKWSPPSWSRRRPLARCPAGWSSTRGQCDAIRAEKVAVGAC